MFILLALSFWSVATHSSIPTCFIFPPIKTFDFSEKLNICQRKKECLKFSFFALSFNGTRWTTRTANSALAQPNSVPKKKGKKNILSVWKLASFSNKNYNFNIFCEFQLLSLFPLREKKTFQLLMKIEIRNLNFSALSMCSCVRRLSVFLHLFIFIHSLLNDTFENVITTLEKLIKSVKICRLSSINSYF